MENDHVQGETLQDVFNDTPEGRKGPCVQVSFFSADKVCNELVYDAHILNAVFGEVALSNITALIKYAQWRLVR